MPRPAGENVAAAAAGKPAAETPAPESSRFPRIAAGQGFYARTLYAVDSDYPGPVVLELLQPPLVGAVAHGGFERVGTRLVLRLTSLTWRGRTVPVDAWAVDPECVCFGVRGEVDRHFLSRVLLPAAARFAEGFMTAMAMPARTLTMQDGAVLHERGESGEREALHAGAGAAVQTLGNIPNGRCAEGDHGADSARHAAGGDGGSPRRMAAGGGAGSEPEGEGRCRELTSAAP